MKKALLAVSFGTSFNDTREKTIDVIERDLAAAFPDRALYRAWTSKIITAKLKETDGVEIDMPADAFKRMEKEGVTDVLVQPTFIIPGLEYDYLTETAVKHEKTFDSLKVGKPLIGSVEDLKAVAEAVLKNIPAEEDEVLILMGHGVFNEKNGTYLDLERKIHDMGHENVFIGTVEAKPGLEDVLEKAKACGFKKAVLAPLLIVSGDHANNDMAGDDEDSWASAFRREGFGVRCILRGMGEFEDIREIFVRHAEEAE